MGGGPEQLSAEQIVAGFGGPGIGPRAQKGADFVDSGSLKRDRFVIEAKTLCKRATQRHDAAGGINDLCAGGDRSGRDSQGRRIGRTVCVKSHGIWW